MDRSTKRTSIILAILVALLIVLFIVSSAYDPGSGCSPAQRENWRERLGTDAVTPGQLSGCTQALGSFTVNGQCKLTIAAADARSRQLTIAAVDAIEIDLTVDADERKVAMRGKIDPGKEKQIPIGKDGKTITISCRTGITCRASVK